ncbi:glycoside hydrolase family 9 protein [Pseudobacteroides cellulosolvens]|uniref:Cellulose 1,4-beta-cellobiosidase n=1 Tax=Pseudobacteroides cellulosolvens ATCC 35603 = DSM 2933 TaxID=398512 RepID=A0A0L6JW36_9FIRM|nr:glycoside hydrolase family 9 protein [Pseudobacteroides cellulosolvens]KNY29939.1 Cellulose 1,4-beta-cellobiosidase [Pseudobacteroides cellulosolvens ATCC 35603 = DSM 2933]
MLKRAVVSVLFVFVLTLLSSTCFGDQSQLLKRTDFTDGFSSPWRLMTSNSNLAYSYVKDGNLTVHMDAKGTNKWDIAVVHDDFSLYQGQIYRLQFKLVASKNCKVYAKIGDKREPYGEAWNNKWSPFSLIADKVLQIETTFTADKDYKDAQFAFHLGGELAGSLPNEVKIISASIIGYTPDPDPTPTPVIDIRVNQLGYYPDSVKKATLKTHYNTPFNWMLKDSQGTIVASGKTSSYRMDHASGEYVQIIDFSDYNTPGTGYTLYAGDASSFPFDIGNNIYSKLQYDALKYFYHARSGIDIKMPYCENPQWSRVAGDLPDKANYSGTASYNGPNILDATGGWYDGGFSTKYLSYNGMALWKMQNQYENALVTGKVDAFKDNSMNIPESGNGYPDILDEARWGMEGLLRMQIPEGYDCAGMASYLIKGNTNYLTTTGEPITERLYSPPSTDATLYLASCAAQASRLWKSIDSNFSGKCLLYAEIAWEAAQKNPLVYQPYNGPSPINPYPSDYFDDEFYWAACELYITTGKSVYLDYIKGSKHYCQMALEIPEYDSHVLQESMKPDFTAGLGTISLALNKTQEFPEALKNITKVADSYISVQNGQGYSMPLAERYITSPFYYSKSSVLRGYPQGSNLLGANNAIVMAYAYALTGDKKYVNGVNEFMDYLLGRNPMVKSYITGYGENPVINPNHGLFAYQDNHNLPKAPGGFLVSGATSLLNAMRAVIDGDSNYLPAQKCYEDDYFNYLTNEVNVDLNASLAWLASFEEARGLIPTSPPKKPNPADINGDGKVNMRDVVEMALAFGTTSKDPNFNKKCDLTNDGAVNMSDVMALAMRFGDEYELPEPGTVHID